MPLVCDLAKHVTTTPTTKCKLTPHLPQKNASHAVSPICSHCHQNWSKSVTSLHHLSLKDLMNIMYVKKPTAEFLKLMATQTDKLSG